MAEINIPTTVTAPDQIQVELVRADHVQTTSVFRTFFEVFLARIIFSGRSHTLSHM